MPLHRANALERTGRVADDCRDEVPAWPVPLDQWDFSIFNRDEILALLLTPSSDPTIWLVAVALADGFGSGWAGAWYGPVTNLGSQSKCSESRSRGPIFASLLAPAQVSAKAV